MNPDYEMVLQEMRLCRSASRSHGKYYRFLQDCDDPLEKPERSIYWDDRAPWLINIDAIPKLSEGVDSVMRAQARNDFPGTYPLGI